MKKLLAALIAAVLVIPALSTSAFAGDPYPGTVDTSTSFKAPKQVQVGERFTIVASVDTPAARAAAGPCKGKYVVKITKGKMKKKKSANTGGASKSFKFKLNKAGVWKINVAFKPATNNPCKASSKTKPIRVTK